MTVYVISVGRSVLETLQQPRNEASVRRLGRDRDLADDIAQSRPDDLFTAAGTDEQDKACEWLSRALAPPADHDSDAAKHLAQVSGAAHPDLWPSTISAELSTFAKVFRAGRARLGAGDTAVLVTSDTTDGLLSAIWNALALTAGDLGRVVLIGAPRAAARTLDNVTGKAVIARVPGMDAGNDAGFRQAMEGLGLLGHALHRSPDLAGQPFEFHLSGGFKASIPYLIGLAEGLRSVSDGRPVKAFVLHETAVTAEGTAIEVPLRRTSPGLIAHELAGFDPDTDERERPDDPESSSLLEGYAYETCDGVQRLTSFGKGLFVLFDLEQSHQGIGP